MEVLLILLMLTSNERLLTIDIDLGHLAARETRTKRLCLRILIVVIYLLW